GDVEQVAAVPHAGGVEDDRRGVADAAVGDQAEAALDLRPHAGQVEAGADDLRVLELVDLRRTALVPRRLERNRRGEAAGVADLVAPGVEAAGAVARGERPGR